MPMCVMRQGKPPQLWRAGKKRVIHYPDHLRVLAPSLFVASRLRGEGVDVHRVLRGFVPDVGTDVGGMRDDRRSILYMGLMELHKGLRTLIEAFHRSCDKHEFNLHMIGEGAMRPWLLREIQRRDLGSRVSAPGFLSNSEIADIRRGAAWSVVPSVWYENAPAVALEALSCGIPVIASDIGGLPEIVTKDAGCELFRPGDSDQLSDRFVSLWEGRQDLAARSRKARVEYEKRFSPETHMSEYLEIVKG